MQTYVALVIDDKDSPYNCYNIFRILVCCPKCFKLIIFTFNKNVDWTRAVTEVTNVPERCLMTSTSTCLVFNVTLDMVAPIKSNKKLKKKQKCQVIILNNVLHITTETHRMFTVKWQSCCQMYADLNL